jgi:hypothetical protein
MSTVCPVLRGLEFPKRTFPALSSDIKYRRIVEALNLLFQQRLLCQFISVECYEACILYSGRSSGKYVQNRGCSHPTKTLVKKPLFYLRA